MAVYARTTTVQGDPASVDAGIQHVRDDVMPAVMRMDGCTGMSMLVDRESGRCIVTTGWRDLAAMEATRAQVSTMRTRAASMLGSDTSDVREWEIALLHRARPLGEGAWARVTWVQMEPAGIQQVLDGFRTTVLPRLEALPGFCSVSQLVDRVSGLGAAAATYESRDALEQSRVPARELRDETAGRLGLRVLDIAEMEVALAHLRVPETV